MTESFPLSLKPFPLQRLFIECTDAAAYLEVGSVGAGKTHALILAALRDLWTPEHRAAIVSATDTRFSVSWIVAQVETIMTAIGVTKIANFTWCTSAGGTLSVFPGIAFMGHGYDFIGVDNSELLGYADMSFVAGRLRMGGTLRCTRGDFLQRLLGRRISDDSRRNLHPSDEYSEALALAEAPKPLRQSLDNHYNAAGERCGFARNRVSGLRELMMNATLLACPECGRVIKDRHGAHSVFSDDFIWVGRLKGVNYAYGRDGVTSMVRDDDVHEPTSPQQHADVLSHLRYLLHRDE